jgi:hypothetical protein
VPHREQRERQENDWPKRLCGADIRASIPKLNIARQPKGFWPQIGELGAPFLRGIVDGHGRGWSSVATVGARVLGFSGLPRITMERIGNYS